MLESSWLW
jgi:hypothetical protein